MKRFFLGLLFSMFVMSVSGQEDSITRGYSVKIGDEAPNFKIEYLDGHSIELKDLRGKVVMLQFTAGWCSVCRKEMPFIEKEIWRELKSNPDFALIAIDLKEQKNKIEKWIKDVGITYPVAKDYKGEIFSLYTEKNAGVTRNIIIDREGKIIFLTRLFNRDEFNKMKEIIKNELEK